MQPFETFTRGYPGLARTQRGASASLSDDDGEQFDREHPFAPSAARPDFLRGASALLPGTMELSGSSQIAGYDGAGNPIGTTGGVIPEQESDRNARLQRGASALLPESQRGSYGAGSGRDVPPAGPSGGNASVAFGTARARGLNGAEGQQDEVSRLRQTMRGASAILAGPEFSGTSQIAGYDGAGNPIGTTGGVIPEQESDRNARLQRGASAILSQNDDTIPNSLPRPDEGSAVLREDLPDGPAPAPRYQFGAFERTSGQAARATPGGTPLFGERTAPADFPKAGAPLRTPTQRTLDPTNMPEPPVDRPDRSMQPGGVNYESLRRLALGGSGTAVNGSAAGAAGEFGNAPGTTRTRDVDLRTLQMAYGGGAGRSDRDVILETATNLASLRAEDAARRRLEILQREGALYDPNASPEVRARQMAYADTLMARAAAGQDLRVGGLAYMGRLSPGYEPATGSKQFTKEAATLAEQILAERSRPRVVDVGTGTRGEPIKAFINPRTGKSEVLKPGKSSGVEAVQIGPRKYFQYGGKLFDEKGEPVSTSRSRTQGLDVLFPDDGEGQDTPAARTDERASPTRILSEKDRQAVEWARANPQDPRAAQILYRNRG